MGKIRKLLLLLIHILGNGPSKVSMPGTVLTHLSKAKIAHSLASRVLIKCSPQPSKTNTK